MNVDEQIVVYSYNGMLFNYKKKQTIDLCNDMDESPRHHSEFFLILFYFYFLKKIFIYLFRLPRVLVAACGIF